MIPVELELGGKDAMIVFDDVNLQRAAAGAAWGGLTTTGQSCTSVERIYVQEPIYEAFKAALVKEVERMKQADRHRRRRRHRRHDHRLPGQDRARQVEDAKAKGARFLTGGDWDGTSRLIPPMVVDQVTDDMLLMREETFGPVLPLLAFESEEEATAWRTHRSMA